MTWIRTNEEKDAEGLLKQIFDAAQRRAGRVFNIVRVQGLNPPLLRSGIGLYQAVMLGASELPRAVRELLAVIVSKSNGCHY